MEDSGEASVDLQQVSCASSAPAKRKSDQGKRGNRNRNVSKTRSQTREAREKDKNHNDDPAEVDLEEDQKVAGQKRLPEGSPEEKPLQKVLRHCTMTPGDVKKRGEKGEKGEACSEEDKYDQILKHIKDIKENCSKESISKEMSKEMSKLIKNSEANVKKDIKENRTAIEKIEKSIENFGALEKDVQDIKKNQSDIKKDQSDIKERMAGMERDREKDRREDEKNINKKLEDHKQWIADFVATKSDNDVKKRLAKICNTASTSMATYANNESDILRASCSILLGPVPWRKDEDNDHYRKHVEKFLEDYLSITGQNLTDLMSGIVEITRLPGRFGRTEDEKTKSPDSIKVVFDEWDQRDFVIRQKRPLREKNMKNKALIDSQQQGSPTEELQWRYMREFVPKCLRPFHGRLEQYAKEIEKKEVFHSQVRFTNDPDVLDVWVQAVDKNKHPGCPWKRIDEMRAYFQQTWPSSDFDCGIPDPTTSKKPLITLF